jgi:hypothetical protein
MPPGIVSQGAKHPNRGFTESWISREIGECGHDQVVARYSVISQLHSSQPDVGLLIFAPEGEYARPEAHGRTALQT